MNPSSHEPQGLAPSHPSTTSSSIPAPPPDQMHAPSPDMAAAPPAEASAPASPVTPTAPTAYPQPTGPGDSPAPSSSATQAGPSKPSSPSVSSLKLLSTHIASHPDHSVGQAIRYQFPNPNPILRLLRRFKVKHSVINGLTTKEEKRWTEEGRALRRKAGWKLKGEEGEGVECGELFWKVSSA